MSNDVILHTPRMILRPFTVQDTCDVYAYARDPRVGPIAGWPAHQSYFESWDCAGSGAPTTRETGGPSGPWKNAASAISSPGPRRWT